MAQKDTTGLKLSDVGMEEEDPITKAIRTSNAAAQGDPAAAAVEAVPNTGPLVDKAATPDYTKLGQFAGKMSAWSQDPNNIQNEKFKSPWDKMSERYKMMTVLSNFDPRKGITPDVINALNEAKINGARFSGEGDRLNATGLQNWENFNGQEGIGDIIKGFKTGNGEWVPWSPEGGGGEAGQSPMPHGPAADFGANLINPALGSGDFFQKLIEQAKQAGGPELTDRNALLSLMQ